MKNDEIDDSDTAAVVFHITEINYDTVPKTRNPNQYYVYHVAEGPQYIRFAVHKELLEFDNFFNLTMSYRRDSDIFTPYDRMSRVLEELKQKYKDTNDTGISATLQMKTRFAVWIVSNCDLTPGARERLDVVEEMVKSGIPVDRRGRCFPDNDPPPGERAERGNGEQFRFLSESKFVLSFENSHNCKDYFTEKLFWNGFLPGSVPIIWGAPKESYEEVIPPHSAIFLDDYPNLKDLAAYLDYLDKNETAYREYFEWRLMDVEEMSDYGRQTSLCQLCRVINGVNIDNLFAPNVPRLQNIPLFGFPEEPRIVKSIHDWEFGDINKRCFEFSPQFDKRNAFSLLSFFPSNILRWYYRLMYPS